MGMARSTCRLCGECDIGCNYGSKNTLDYNYLSAASRAGATIRDLLRGAEFAPRPGGGYVVRYVSHDLGAGGPAVRHPGACLSRRSPPTARARGGHASARPISCCATAPVCRASAAGPGHALLRQRRPADAGAPAATGRDRRADRASRAASGRRSRWRFGSRATPDPDAPPGSPGRGFYIEDAGYPDLLNWLVQAAESPGALAARLVHTIKRLSCGCWAASPTRMSARSSRACSATPRTRRGSCPSWAWAARCRSASSGSQDGRLTADWTIDRSVDYFEQVRGAQEELAAELGAEFRDNPAWNVGRRVITVHPLGGAPMGR